MKLRLMFFSVGLLALPLFAAAQNVQLLTISSPTQPSNGTALPNTTVAAVAVTLTAGNAAVTVTNIIVERVGSAQDSSVVGLDVRDSATNIITTVGGSATPFNSAHKVTIPLSVSLAAGQSKTLLVSAKVASNITSAQGQFFELNITGIGTGAVLSGALPMYGAQYTLSSGVSKPTCFLTATPNFYSVGQTVTLQWSSTNATGGTITGLGSVAPKGSQGILPAGSSSTYVGTFTGPGGTGTCSATVTRSTSGTGGSGGTVFQDESVAPPGSVQGSGSLSGSGTTGSGTGVNAPKGVSSGGNVTAQGTFGSGSNFGSGNTFGPGGTVNPPGTVQPPANSGGTSLTSDPRTIPGTGGTGGISDVCTGINCRPCDVAPLVQRIINWLIGFSIPLAAAMFAWAGILYFTSAANPTGIERARRTFMWVFWGVITVLGGWLAIQTILYFLLTPQVYRNWNKIDCSNAPHLTDEKPANWLMGILGRPNMTQVTPSVGGWPQSSVYQCPSGYGVTQADKTGGGGVSCTATNCTSSEGCASVAPTCSGAGVEWNAQTQRCLNTATGNEVPLTAVQTIGSTGSSGTDEQNRQLLATNGIQTISTGNCADKTNSTCTSLDGVNSTLLNDVISMHNSGLSCVAVSGGIETGHASSLQNSGQSVDLSACNSSCGYADANAVASCLLTASNAAQSVNRRLDFECNNASVTQQVQSAVQGAGLSLGSTRIMTVGYATGSGAFPCHFSIY